jgi:hypothetical protein
MFVLALQLEHARELSHPLICATIVAT